MIPTQSALKDFKYQPFGLWHHLVMDSTGIVYDTIAVHYQDHAEILSRFGYRYILNAKALNEAFGL